MADVEVRVRPAGFLQTKRQDAWWVQPLVVFVILWRLRGRLKKDGRLFALYLGLYAVGKFAITFVRLDPVYFWGLQQSHLVALGLLAIAIVWGLWGRLGQLAIGTPRFSQ